MKKCMFVFGTRPEAIKMAPLVKEFQRNTSQFQTIVCVTGQHREMLDQVLNFFEIVPDFDLNLMKPGQSLIDVTCGVLKGLETVIDEAKPDVIFVQGDTTTVFAGSVAAFYKQVKIAHIEAGLRSGNLLSPFPEEGNRVLTSRITDFHFAPTEAAVSNLNKEGISQHVYNVGNTVIDALYLGLDIIKKNGEDKYLEFFNFIDFSKKVILVTGHRRESFGNAFENICMAIKRIIDENPDVEIVYPVHLNPNVREPVNRILKGVERVHLIEPLNYPYLICLMNHSYLVLTDSGGIQEEAPSIGKPVLVMREVTERMEGVFAGTAKLVGTNLEKIVTETNLLLNDKDEYQRMAQAINPYGDGKTSQYVLDIMIKEFGTK